MKKRLLIFFACFLGSLFPILNVQADETSDPNKLANFTTEAALPENQFNKNVTYYDLMVEPGSKQDLTVIIKNTSNEKMTISPSINRAHTNLVGVVTYSTKSKEKAPNLKYNIEDIVTLDQTTIEIEPNESYSLPIHINTPNEKFDGVLAGGLYLFKEDKTKNKGNVKNYFAREIAILLRSDPSSTELSGNLKVIKASAGQENYRNVTQVLFENDQPAFLSNFSIDARVSKKGTSETLYEVSTNGLSMAPNSSFNFQVPLNGASYEAGTYTVKGTYSHNDQKEKFEKEFTVSKEEEKKYNEKDVTIDRSSIFDSKLVIALFVLLSALMLVILLILFIYLKNKKKRKKAAQRRRIAQQRKKRKKKKPSDIE